MDVKLCSVGGYNEVGKNMTALRVGDEVIILDMGFFLPKLISFEEGDIPRKDIGAKELMKAGAIPDDTVLESWRDKVKAIAITHCHLDHCLHPGSYIQLANGEIEKVENVPNNVELGCIDLNSAKYDPAFCRVKSILKSPKTILDIKTKLKRIKSTEEHKFFVLNDKLELGEKRANQLKKGDFLATIRKIPYRGKRQNLQKLENNGRSMKIKLPKKTSPEICQFLGYVLGDGNASRKDRKKRSVSLRCTDKDIHNLEFYKNLGEKIFATKGKIYIEQRNRLIFHSTSLVRFIDSISERILTYSPYREIPKVTHRTTKKEVAAFLRGLYDAEGCVKDHSIVLCSSSENIIFVTQMFLLRFGIYSYIQDILAKYNTKSDRDSYQLVISYPNSIKKFYKEIGFSSQNKLKRLKLVINKVGGGVGERIEIYPITSIIREIMQTFDLTSTNLRKLKINESHYLRSHCASKNKLKHLLRVLNKKSTQLKKSKKKEAKETLDKINKLVNSDLLFEPIKEINKIISDSKEVIDLTVPGHSNFIANGIIVHNSGAVPYLANKYNAPIIGTRFTTEVLKSMMKDDNINLKNELKVLNPNSVYEVSKNIKIEFINMTHSTLQTVMIAVHTPKGVILYANDFKFDNHPVIGKKPNYDALKSLRGDVLALIVDSLYAPGEWKTPSEKVAREMLKDIMLGTDNEGHAIITTTFASHLARLKSIIDFSRSLDRKVVFLGRSLAKYTFAAERSEILNYSKKVEILSYRRQIEKRLKKIEKDRDKYVIVCTGNQGEPRSVLVRMASGQLPFKFLPEDHVIFSCKTIPVEANLNNRALLESKLKHKKARIFTDIHSSGHPGREDLRDLVDMIKPKHIFPVHGNAAQDKAMADLAVEMGYKKDKNVHLMHNGGLITLK